MTRHTAIYIRVSTTGQSHESQRPDIERWIKSKDPKELGEIKWYQDTGTGRTENRPAWQELQVAFEQGQISRIVCWRLDRLGRREAALHALFDQCVELDVDLISLKDNLDLKTPVGRLVAGVISSIAAFELELRRERQSAGIAAAQARGKKWGGKKKGQLSKMNRSKLKRIKELATTGLKQKEIAVIVGLSASTVVRAAKGDYNHLESESL